MGIIYVIQYYVYFSAVNDDLIFQTKYNFCNEIPRFCQDVIRIPATVI